MSITQAEIKWYKALTNNNTSANGGVMTATVSPSGVKNSIWPDVSQADRVAGATHYRKFFIKVDNLEGTEGGYALQESKVFVENLTPGDDSITIFPGTATDMQATITGSERQYGCGTLNTGVSAGATTLSVLTEGSALGIFQEGDKVRVSDKADVNDNTGNEEYVTIVVASLSYTGDVATFDVTPALASDYAANTTRVASVIESFGSVQATAGTLTVSSSAGTYDDATYPIVVRNDSGVDQTWTLTFTDSSTFTIAGDTLGAVTGGNITTGASPNNPDYSAPYFTIDAAGFGGTFAASDSIQFTTVSASMPIWSKRIIPAGANAISVNGVVIACDGTSV